MGKHKLNQVRAGAVVSYITIFFNILSGFIYTPWLIRQLGQSDYALYSLVTSVMTYFVLDFGMGAAITRFIARYRVNGEREKIDQLLGVTSKLYLALDALILVALVVAYSVLDRIYVNLSPAEIVRFKGVFVIAGIMSLLSFPFLPINGVYTAYEKLYAQKLFDLLAKVVSVGSIVLSILLGGGLYAVVLLNAFITFVMQLVKFLYISRTEHLKVAMGYRDRELVRSIFRFSVWVMLATIADRFFFTFVPSMLGIVSNTVEIAIFSVAVSVESYVNLFSSAFSNLFLPRVTAMVVKNRDPEEITDLMIRVGRIQLIVVSAVVTLMVSMGPEFIRCWVGEGYERSYLVIVLILLPSLVHFSQAIATEMIYATDNVKYRALVYAAGSAISIVTTFALGPRYGAVGAGLGIGIALLVSHVLLMNFIYYKKLKLNVMRYFKQCHFRMYPTLCLSGLIGYALMKVYPVNSLFLFLIKAGVWGILHLVLLWFTVLNPYEKSLATDAVKKLIRR